MSDWEFPIVEDCGSKPVTVVQALQEGAEILGRLGIDSARLDAEILLGIVLGGGREQIYLNYEMPFKIHDVELYHRLLLRRTRGGADCLHYWSPGILVARFLPDLGGACAKA